MAQKNSKGHRKLWNVLTTTSALLCAVAVTGNTVANMYSSSVNAFLGIEQYKVVKDESISDEDRIYYASSYDTEEEARAAGQALCEVIEEEGAVLLKNLNDTLPMSSSAKVTVLGRASVDLVYGGTGSSATGDYNEKITIKQGLEKVGITVNDTVLDFYTEMSENSAYTRITSEDVTGVDWQLGEVGVDEFTDEVYASFEEYNDMAIVVLSRSGGEGADLPAGDFVDGSNYLALQDVEKELIAEAEANFDTVIVLINSANALEIAELEADDEIDAIVWIGQPGDNGMYGIADLLVGNENFSGKMVDTYVTSNLSAAAAQNMGNYNYANADEIDASGADSATTYIVEAEGIYIGYRYYETRYEDTVLGQGGADSTVGSTTGEAWSYTDEVVYPFGYGLSYTTYEQTLDAVAETEDGFEVTVTVTNTGDVAGESIVQLYAQVPYTDYDREYAVEKASIELVGFARTEELEPGASETVTIEVDKYDLASYDYTGYKTYILEEGDYYLSLGDDAHDALNNVLAAKGYTTEDGMDYDGDADKTYTWTEEETDTTTYAVSVSGAEVTNQLDSANLNYYGEGLVTYLTRDDWEGTFPESYDELTATEEMIDDLNHNDDYEPGDSDISSITLGADNGVQLIELRGLDYDDELWEDLLDELTIEDMANFLGQGSFSLNEISSIGSPSTIDQDGPLGVCGNTITGVGYGMTKYPSTVVLASTWDVELANEYGVMLGEEALQIEVDGIYGGGLNVHRTAYSGRNFEYYSEDSFLGGQMAAAEAQGCNEMGLRTYFKHFALNDQEDNRRGVSTFVNEQAAREILLKQFEFAVVDGEANGIMSSYNRVGCVYSGAVSGLHAGILVGEWGFHGDSITDLHFGETYYDPFELITSGGVHEFAIADTLVSMLEEQAAQDVKLLSAMREACHRSLYTIVNSAAMNGIGAGDVTVAVTPWWKPALIGLEVAFAAMTVLFAVLYFVSERKRKQVKAE